MLERVERLTGMRPDRNRPLVAAILLLTFICLFFFNRIGFDSDMMHLNYDPPRLAAAQQRLDTQTNTFAATRRSSMPCAKTAAPS